MIGYLGLGSNVGDRRAELEAAARALPARGVDVLASSSVYETEPVGEVLHQPDFLNACVASRPRSRPRSYWTRARRSSTSSAVPGGPRHGPRPIDVDVLLLGDVSSCSRAPPAPPRGGPTRRFVLVPLLELDPALRTPDGTLADALGARGEGQDVLRAGPPLA